MCEPEAKEKHCKSYRCSSHSHQHLRNPQPHTTTQGPALFFCPWQHSRDKIRLPCRTTQ